MNDHTVFDALIVRRADFRRLPAGFLRKRFWPLLLLAVLVAVVAVLEVGAGLERGSGGAVQRGLSVLKLLAIPGILALLQYIDVLVTLKIIKFDELKSSKPDQSAR